MTLLEFLLSCTLTHQQALMQDYLHLQVWLCRYSPSGAQAGQRLWPTSGTQLLILAAARIAPYIQLGKLASHTPGRPATGGQKAYIGRMGLRASSGPPDKHKSKYSRSNGSHHAPSNATCATWLCFSPSCLGAMHAWPRQGALQWCPEIPY